MKTTEALSKVIQLVSGEVVTVEDPSGVHNIPLEVTPQKDTQSIEIPDDGSTTGYNPVTVYGDSNLIPANIKEGVSIFGVTGQMAGKANGSYYPVIKGTFIPYTGSTTLSLALLGVQPKMAVIKTEDGKPTAQTALDLSTTWLANKDIIANDGTVLGTIVSAVFVEDHLDLTVAWQHFPKSISNWVLNIAGCVPLASFEAPPYGNYVDINDSGLSEETFSVYGMPNTLTTMSRAESYAFNQPVLSINRVRKSDTSGRYFMMSTQTYTSVNGI